MSKGGAARHSTDCYPLKFDFSCYYTGVQVTLVTSFIYIMLPKKLSLTNKSLGHHLLRFIILCVIEKPLKKAAQPGTIIE